MDVYSNSKRIRLEDKDSIGKGGEADVYLKNGIAIKIYKQPDHPDYENLPDEQNAARIRIAEHQDKLPALIKACKSWPKQIMTPYSLVTDRSGKIILGYSMPFVSQAEVFHMLSKRQFHEAIGHNNVVGILKILHKLVNETHKAGVIIGDCNDLNILLSLQSSSQDIFLIDADSYQFGKYKSRTFTQRFVDPLHCTQDKKSMMLNKMYIPQSDWYSYSVIAMECMLLVDPYGGIYKPKNNAKKLSPGLRPLHRITVFHDDVKYPKPAIPYGYLPDELVDYFMSVFVQDKRGEFPIELLDNLRWTKCSVCGTEHARPVCPGCALPAPSAVKKKISVRGTVTSISVFKTNGIIVYSAVQNDKLHYLYYEDNEFKRENDTVVFTGKLNSGMRFRLNKEKTLIGNKNKVAVFKPKEKPDTVTADTFGRLPVFDANEKNVFWLSNGNLHRDSNFGLSFSPDIIGNVLNGQTQVWVGKTFGFGFYRAGHLCRAFVFGTDKKVINDKVQIPQIRGQLIGSTAVFAKERCWFLIASQENGKTMHKCIVIKSDGAVEAVAETEQNDGSWLGNSLDGKCAMNNFMLVPTDEGVLRVEPDNGKIVTTKEFPDTESFVDAGCTLHLCSQGLYVVNRNDIKLLQIN